MIGKIIKNGLNKMRKFLNFLIAKTIADILIEITYSEVYCSIHNEKLIHNKIIININTPIEIGYCYKCNKEYTEYSDINPIYISNYEHIVKELDDI